jgi:hypothetical protein
MRVRLLGCAIFTVLAVLVSAPAALASYPGGSVGHDVSYPQCSSGGAASTSVGSLGGSFGIVGVNGGRPWGGNSCAAAEFAWASGLANPPAVYMNTANPAPRSSFYWPASGSSDPAACRDSASTTDPGCAYDYGWHAAADALSTQAKSIPNAAGLNWWLDVESGNSWNGDGISNAADLQGAVDYLRSHGVPSVGLYSTGSQWAGITGGYSTSTAGGYADAWAAQFTALYPMTSSPVWVAGLGSVSSASAACATSFTGGPTWLAQYVDGSGYDADLACAASSPSPPGAPQQLSATGGDSAVALTWAAPVTGANVTYSVYRGSGAGGESTTPIASGLAATSYRDTAVTNGMTYFYYVSSTNAGGTSAGSNEASASPTSPAQSFAISLSPAKASVKRGSSAKTAVNVAGSGPTQTVTLTTSATPAGVTATLTPTSVSGTGTSAMTITISRAAASGTYPIAVTGSGTSTSQTTTYTLTVR